MIVFRELDSGLVRDGFDCGNDALNTWFRTQAGQHQRRDAARTHVGLATFDSAIAAYYALGVHRVELVVVDAIDRAAFRFYEHHGFSPLTEDGSRLFVTTRHMRDALVDEET